MAHSEELPLAGEQASLPRPPAPPQQLQGQLPTHGGHKASGGKGGEALEASGKEASTQMPHWEQEQDDQDQDHGHDLDQAQDLAEGLRADGGSSEAGQVHFVSSLLSLEVRARTACKSGRAAHSCLGCCHIIGGLPANSWGLPYGMIHQGCLVMPRQAEFTLQPPQHPS